jgi:hypothetical protein
MVVGIRGFRYFKKTLYLLLSLFIMFGCYLFIREKVFSRLREIVSSRVIDILYGDICNNISIEGLKRASIDRINGLINDFCDSNAKSINTLFKDIKEDVWIKELRIRRTIPNDLKIEMVEYIPFVIVNDDGILKLIDENEHQIKIKDYEFAEFSDFVKIGGEDAFEHIRQLFNLLLTDQDVLEKIALINRIGKRRWDFILKNGILVKMPETNGLSAAYKEIGSILKTNESNVTIKTIDLRDGKKVFIEWK